ncbi:MAG: QacE family quaternary ammonium compound efflux SMR transporter [Mariprofundaceae bacterium]|nr:QacE family quaternary ammonium compound efflux SMR transporter [Mariprofundaceae bacterium]
MHWIYLSFAIVFEVAGTTAMKLSDGFSKWLPSTLMALFYIISFALLALALKKLEVGMSYAIWAGVGTALIALIGVLWFKEPMNALKAVSILLIIAGVVGLNLSGAKA